MTVGDWVALIVEQAKRQTEEGPHRGPWQQSLPVAELEKGEKAAIARELARHPWVVDRDMRVTESPGGVWLSYR